VNTPSIIIHDSRHAAMTLEAADAAGTAVVLLSPPGAGAALGPGVFKALADTAMTHHPGVTATAILDCGDEAGVALAAIRHGCTDIAVDLPGETLAKIEDLAARAGTKVHPGGRAKGKPGAPLDLAREAQPETAARAYLDTRSGHE